MAPVSKANKFDRKLQGILSAAVKVFAETGYDRATIRMVAARAGVSIAGLYYYVTSKEELLYLVQLHAFESLVEQYNAEAASLAEPEERLELLIRNHLTRFLGDLSELYVCSRELDRLRGDAEERVGSVQREYFGLAVAIFEELSRKHGALAVTPRMAALSMFGSINWVYTWYRPGAGPAAAEVARDFLTIQLHGVLPPPKSEGGRALPQRPRETAEDGQRPLSGKGKGKGRGKGKGNGLTGKEGESA